MPEIFADLHIHSKYSRATSKQMDVKQLVYYAHLKGLKLLGTGDCTHPTWLRELKQNLHEFNDGIYLVKHSKYEVFFMITGEVCTIHEHGEKVRKVHHVLFLPSLETAEAVNDILGRYADLSADGRPIFNNLSPATLVEILSEVDSRIMIFPAHLWTPWFGALGSKSGFDSVTECYEDKTDRIKAIETGLSSDPPMNWRVSSLDKYTLLSFSDSHSPWPWRLGREATVFKLETLSYREIVDSISKKDRNRILFTVEVDPRFGKYHWTGCRRCNFSVPPGQYKLYGGRCPNCGRKMTVGVADRVEELADRPENAKPLNAIPYMHLIPLSELLSVYYKKPVHSKLIWQVYVDSVKKVGSEFEILIKAPEEKLLKIFPRPLVKFIIKNRRGELKIKPGYDGIYGELMLEEEFLENGKTSKMQRLDEFFYRSQ